MGKKAIIGIGILVLLLIVGKVVYMSMKKAPTTNTKPVKNNTSAKAPESQGTLSSLLRLGTSQKCNYSNSTANTTVNGSVEVSQGKMRGDFTSTSSQMTLKGHVIVDSGYSYFWTDGTNQGYKFALNQPTVSPSSGKGPDLNQSVKYSCQPWVSDSSVFTLPSDITFNSFAVPTTGNAQNVTGSPVTNGNSTMCAACNNIPAGPARTSCLTQLHCQ